MHRYPSPLSPYVHEKYFQLYSSNSFHSVAVRALYDVYIDKINRINFFCKKEVTKKELAYGLKPFKVRINSQIIYNDGKINYEIKNAREI